MPAFMKWARKLCSSKHREHPGEQDDEQKKIGQLATLSDLQCTMDPSVAAQVYNNNHSPLCRLPDELLLYILHCVGDDILSIYCLRRVSRSFRRLIDEPEIWKYMLLPLSRNCRPRAESSWNLPADLRNQLRQRLQRDGMCDECKVWCDVPVKRWFRQIIQASNLEYLSRCRAHGTHCKFGSGSGSGSGFASWYRIRPQCDVCGNHQDMPASSSPSYHARRERRCLGCQGAVQLCEHVHISWATVEAHITDWQQRKPGDWQACFDKFDVECHDPSHDTRCTAEEAPTWPRARLQIADCDRNLVILNLEWKPHSGLDTFTCTSDGRALATELRALFRKYRQGPAYILFPSHPSNPLPEMMCFNLTECICLHYEKEDSKRPSAVDPSKQANFFCKDWPYGCRAWHYSVRGYGYGRDGQQVDMSGHWPRGRCNSVCLITTYQRDVVVCHKADRSNFKPTHQWFHAMDPDTYPHPNTGHVLPLCKDKDCMNYYRRPKSMCVNAFTPSAAHSSRIPSMVGII